MSNGGFTIDKHITTSRDNGRRR
ncbi:hypothetical protein VCHC02C1_0919A, partial [Vibrio cholerae HC-02C1]